ncbi:MAG: M12 family metallopeptidase [Roseibium sp.]
MARTSIRREKDNNNSEIIDRIEKIELLLEHLHDAGISRHADVAHSHEVGYCGLPLTLERTFNSSVSAHREELIRYIDKKWVNGTKLKYFLFENGPYKGTPTDLQFIRDAFDIWEGVGIGLSFEEVGDILDAEVRVGFKKGDGSWSYVGRDVLDIPGQNERTMNIGWDLRHDPRGVDTAVHEIGHTLGFPHEHQNPFAGIEWDEEAVYRYFAGSPNFWSRDRTYHNVLRKLSSREVEGSAWDPNSIMHYGFGPGLIKQPIEYATGLTPSLGLSRTDKSEVRKLYPKTKAHTFETLIPFNSQQLHLSPAEQANFLLCPDATREYQIRCFGDADVLMVLFRKDDEEYRYMAGNDDSGTELNAELKTRLEIGSEYVLRVRLFADYGSQQTAIMYW